MAYTGARVADALARNARGLGQAFMQIGSRQQRDEEMESERQYRAGRDAIADRNTDMDRRMKAESLGYAIIDPNSNPLGRSINAANKATGSQPMDWMMGERDPTRSFAFQDAKAVEEYKTGVAQKRSEDAIRNLYGTQNTTAMYEDLPADARASADADTQYRSGRILTQYGDDMAGALAEAQRIGGIVGRRVENQIKSFYGEQSLADLTKDDDLNWQLAQGLDPETGRPIVAHVHPRTHQVVPLDIDPKTGSTPGTGTMQERLNEKLGTTAEYANQMLDQVDSSLTGLASSIAARPGRLSGLANLVTDDRSQAAATAALNFVNPAVRYLSGAQMNEQEAQRYYAALIPRMGDNPSTVQMKRAMRQALIRAMRTGEWQGQPNPDGTPNTANIDAFLADFTARYGGGAAPAGGLPDDIDAAAEEARRRLGR